MRAASLLGLLFVGGSLALACSSSSSDATPQTGDDAGSGDDDTTGDDAGVDAGLEYPAAHPPMPQVQAQSNVVMSAPKVVPITFTGDTLVTDIETFVSQVAAATDYWHGAVGEYGVGTLTAATPIHVNETPAATLSDADVQTWLTGKITSDASFPKPDANTLYMIFYPTGVTVTQGSETSCNEFQGYHGNVFGSATLSYSVIPRCPPPVQGISEMDAIAATASHEIIEAATDPTPFSSPSWSRLDDDHRGWAMVGGGEEIGDVCAPFPGVFSTPKGITNLVQHVWSNAAAAAGHDPCQPLGISPYFNSAPVLKDALTVTSPFLGGFTTKGVKIPVGQTKTIELDFYSDGPTGEWTVSAIDVANLFFGDAATLEFTFDKTKGKNGDKINLTIKALAKSSLGASPFWIQNDLGGNSTVWLGLVGN